MPQSLDSEKSSLSRDDAIPACSDQAGCNDAEETGQYDNIPKLVRDVVSFEELPTVTFRVIVLSAIFVAVGAFAGQLSFFRTTSAPFSVFFIVLVSWPLGKFMDQILPAYRVPLGPLSFSLNPAPFSIKEHVLIGIAGNAGANGNWATYLAANAKIYYNIDMNHAVALFFGFATSIIGFIFTILVRSILIHDPMFIFPLSLQDVTVYRAMHLKEEHGKAKQMKGFWIICGAIFIWQFIFPLTASLAPLCWMGRRNRAANFIGSGMHGMGVLNLTLNVSNITSSIITQPFFVQVIMFSGFVITMWILVPIAHFGKVWGSPTFSVMSNGLYTHNGSSYPFTSLLLPDGQLNQTRYEEVGLAYAGAQYLWDIFFAYAAFISSFVWMVLFAGPQVSAAVKAAWTGTHVRQDPLRYSRFQKFVRIVERVRSSKLFTFVDAICVWSGTGAWSTEWRAPLRRRNSRAGHSNRSRQRQQV
uniref:OPT oligopeptide transporter n=1 Tax=Mycena chlorophos TaxID=658473 RepID=A0ABQ0KWD1_MYCCL|nr:OPT oligopeptide transporter [Mycena chlorophos]